MNLALKKKLEGNNCSGCSIGIHRENFDIWELTKKNDVDGVIDLVSDSGGVIINERNEFGETPLHIAATLGFDTVMGVLLKYGADPNLADWESHWTPLHRALYFGHLKSTLLLLKHGAYLGDEELYGYVSNKQDKFSHRTSTSGHLNALKGEQWGAIPYCYSGYNSADRFGMSGHKKLDRDGNSPLDLLSLHLKTELKTAATEGDGGDVWAFGKADFQLGFPVPNALVVERPKRVGALGLQAVVSVCASRHHTVALTKTGKIFTWGHGRGGRLGHGDENPRMTPTLVHSISHKQMVAIAAAENHTCCVRQDGVVYSWGSDRFGQLGHTAHPPGRCKLDPKKIEALRKCKVVGISAGAAHTVALTEEGEVYAWGSNKAGQLGVSSREKAAAAATQGLPRRIDSLVSKGRSQAVRKALQVSAAAQSTVIIMESSFSKYNEVFQWGHGNPVPTRVYFGSKKDGNRSRTKMSQTQPWSHVNIVQVSAARLHNVALSSVGTVYTWGLGAENLGLEPHKPATHTTASPQLVEAMLPSAGGGVAVAVSASENHTCVVTETGDLYTWGATADSGVLGHGHGKWQPIAKRVAGIKRAAQVSAAPDHTVVLLAASQPTPCHMAVEETKPLDMGVDTGEDMEAEECEIEVEEVSHHQPLSLKQTCEKILSGVVDLRNAVSILAHAEAYEAPALTAYCASFIRQNLDGILVLGRPADMEFLLEDAGECLKELLESHASKSSGQLSRHPSVESDLEAKTDGLEEILEKAKLRKLSWGQSLGKDPTPKMVAKAARYTKKKLAQIATLEKMELSGHILSQEQLDKIQRKPGLEMDLKKLQPLLAKFELLDRAALARSLSMESFGAESEDGSLGFRSPRGSMLEPAQEHFAPNSGKHSGMADEHAAEEEPRPAGLRRQRSIALSTCPETEELPSTPLPVPEETPTSKVYRCDLCDITCHDRIMLQQHLKGKKHAKRTREVQEKMAAESPTSRIQGDLPKAPWSSCPEHLNSLAVAQKINSNLKTKVEDSQWGSPKPGSSPRPSPKPQGFSPEVQSCWTGPKPQLHSSEGLCRWTSPKPQPQSDEVLGTPNSSGCFSNGSCWATPKSEKEHGLDLRWATPQKSLGDKKVTANAFSAPAALESKKKQNFRDILEAQHEASGLAPTRNLSAVAAKQSPKPSPQASTGHQQGINRSDSFPDALSTSPNISLADFMRPARKHSKEKEKSPKPAWATPTKTGPHTTGAAEKTKKSFMEIQQEEEEHQKVEVSGVKDTAWYIHEKRVRSEGFDKIQQQQQHEAELKAAMEAIAEMERAEQAQLEEAKKKKEKRNRARNNKRDGRGAQRKKDSRKGDGKKDHAKANGKKKKPMKNDKQCDQSPNGDGQGSDKRAAGLHVESEVIKDQKRDSAQTKRQLKKRTFVRNTDARRKGKDGKESPQAREFPSQQPSERRHYQRKPSSREMAKTEPKDHTQSPQNQSSAM